MKYLYGLLLATCISLLGCSTPTSLETEFSCDGIEQSQATYLQGQAGKTIQTKYPITIDFRIRRKTILIKTYVADIVANDRGKLTFSIKSGENWIRGQFDKNDKTLSFLSRQALDLDQESMQTQLSGQYVCRGVSNKD